MKECCEYGSLLGCDAVLIGRVGDVSEKLSLSIMRI
jgi:hypothetical protein